MNGPQRKLTKVQANTANVRINDMISNSNTILPGETEGDFLHVEDYDANLDAAFVKDELVPYFRDLYKDMLMRSN